MLDCKLRWNFLLRVGVVFNDKRNILKENHENDFEQDTYIGALIMELRGFFYKSKERSSKNPDLFCKFKRLVETNMSREYTYINPSFVD